MDRKQAHIDLRRLSIGLLLTLILPVGVALLLDVGLATLPLLTMGIALICIPLATIVVLRIALGEMDRVIAAVAPPDSEVEKAQNPDGNGAPDANA